MSGRRGEVEGLAETRPGDLASDSTQIASADDQERSPETRGLVPGATVDGRYVIDRVLGRGGMGTVYLARDVQLGREVALKVHRRTSEAERLYREAIAMAQLDHPNVVTVFEVGVLDDHRFVAMEYVRGSTLRAWAVGRRWREIAEMLLGAGEGLYAAHKKGLVHRDFKPENVLVDEDHRPRVSDFGLARQTDDVATYHPASSRPSAPTSGAMTPMTMTGSILGTPAYMAPEQFAGDYVDARGDQFAYCITAWELLYGRRPFRGATYEELAEALKLGAIESPPADSEVPRAVERVLRRGLAHRPAERWPDMAALLAALRVALRPRARRMPILAATVAVAIVGGGLVAWARMHRDTCGSAGADLDALVSPALRQKVIDSAAHGGTGAIAQRNLVAFADTYHSGARLACEAAARHDWSADLAARSRSCRREQVHRLATVFEAEVTGTSYRMGAATTSLPEHAELPPCSDPAILVTRPVMSDGLAEARGEVLAAYDLAEVSGFDDAQKLVDRIQAGPFANAPELAAPLGITRAVLAHEHDLEPAIKLASDAYYRAHGTGDGVTELIALRSLLYWIGDETEDAGAVEPWYRLALSEIDRIERQSPSRTAALRIAIVGVAMTRNELPVAVEQARLASQEAPADMPLLRATALREYAGALSESGADAKAVPLYDESIRLLVATIGEDDVQVAQTLGDFALTLSAADDKERAVATVNRAVAILTRHKLEGVDRATLDLNFGVVLLNAHDAAGARPRLVEARAAIADQSPTPLLAAIDNAMADLELVDHHPAEAARLVREALAIDEPALGRDHPDVATSQCTLAAALRDQHQLADALAAARRCQKIRDTSLPDSLLRAEALAVIAELENASGAPEEALRDAAATLALAVPHTTLESAALPRLEQARALITLGRDRALAGTLLTEARSRYEAAHDSAAVADIAALQDKLR